MRSSERVAAAFLSRVFTVLNREELVAAADHVLGEEKPGGELLVRTGVRMITANGDPLTRTSMGSSAAR